MRCLRDTWSDGSDGTPFERVRRRKPWKGCTGRVRRWWTLLRSGFCEDPVRGLPDDLHPGERRIARTLVRRAERVVPHDTLGLPQRPARPQRPVHLEVRAVDRITEGVKERDVSLEGRDGPGALVAICKCEGDVVLVALLVGILRQERLVDDAHHERRVELTPQRIAMYPCGRGLFGLGLSSPCRLGAPPREDFGNRHGVLGRLPDERRVGGDGEESARVGECQPEAVGRVHHRIEPYDRYARGEERLLLRA